MKSIIKKSLFPLAGYGTRFLPATKVQYGAEEWIRNCRQLYHGY